MRSEAAGRCPQNCRVDAIIFRFADDEKEIMMSIPESIAMLAPNKLGRVAWFGSALLAAFLAGCVTPYPPAPIGAASSDYNYKIGPLDSVNVIVWRNPELSMSVPVRPDGKITTPLIEDLPVLGRTSTELARDMEKALVKFIRDPVVTVIVTNFIGPTKIGRASCRERVES